MHQTKTFLRLCPPEDCWPGLLQQVEYSHLAADYVEMAEKHFFEVFETARKLSWAITHELLHRSLDVWIPLLLAYSKLTVQTVQTTELL